MTRLRFGTSFAAVIVLSLAVFTHDAQASNWGSWGSSRGSSGSWGSRGSNGSWGSSRGGFYRTPVRNLLGRIGNRLSSGGSWGSRGSNGSHGSSGYSRGSWGRASRGYSYVSTNPQYGSWGSSNQGTVYMAPNYEYPATSTLGCSSCDAAMTGAGVPINGYPMGSEIPMGTTPGVYDTQNYDGVPQQDVPGASPFQTPPSEGLDSNPIDPPSPSPADEDISIPREGDDAILTVNVPEDARVYINGKATSTPGTKRSYVSRRLKPGKIYTYRVKVVLDRDGSEIVRNKTVKLSTGLERMVAFAFDRPAMTTLTLNVPKDAKVVLCGCKTSAVGRRRHYRTNTLVEGEVWDDYTIEVSLEKDGQLLTRRESIKIIGGEVRTIDFDFDTPDKIAAK